MRPRPYVSVEGVLFSADQTLLHTCPAGKTGAYRIPDSVTGVVEYAFTACRGLTSLTIPDSVTTIDGCAFQACSSLTSVTIPGAAIHYNSAGN